MTDVEIDTIVNDIFSILRKHFAGYVEINRLYAEQETTEDLEKIIIKYYDYL